MTSALLNQPRSLQVTVSQEPRDSFVTRRPLRGAERAFSSLLVLPLGSSIRLPV